MNQGQTDWYSILTGFGSKSMNEIGVIPFLGIMIISLFSAFFIAFLYVRFYKNRSTGSLIYRAFPLLGMSITAIFISIQFSLPLSLGLLGALSIVRFRTPIKEPEEIGFIMLVVATSLCCATFNMLFLAIILGSAVFALLAQKFGARFFLVYQNDGVLVLEMDSAVYNQKHEQILDNLQSSIKMGRIDSVSQNNDVTIISYNFQKVEDTLIPTLKKSLLQIDDSLKFNVYFNNAGAM